MPRTKVSVSRKKTDCDCEPSKISRFRRWIDALAMLAVVMTAAVLLKETGIFSLSASVSGATSLVSIALIGVVAASSTCLAVVGGLLLSISAKWTELHQPETHFQKLRPLLLFNAGRLLGYFVLGGLIGLLGTALLPSVTVSGWFTVILAMVMLLLGVNILQLVPKRYCTIPLPRSMRTALARLTESDSVTAPLLLGALTFFLPCGFTQSMQLLALGSGSFLGGGLIMLAFALGTLPALLGISVISSLVEGRFARAFLTFSGVTVLLLGIFNLQSGLTLAGIDAGGMMERTFATFIGETDRTPANQTGDPYVTITPDGRQIITVYVSDDGYSPSSFTIAKAKETWVYAIAERPLAGCANFLVAPSFNISQPINQGANWLGPITNPEHDFLLTCSMGRLRAEVTVK